jgi:HEAT repeat protein
MLKEDRYLLDARGRPDLKRYVDPLEYYVRMYMQHLDSQSASARRPKDAVLEYRRRVHATWGLIAKGAAAVPFALELLGRREPDAREDGAAILGELGRDEAIVDLLRARVGTEQDLTARDALIGALGELKSRRGIPALAAVIRNPEIDGDTRHTAVESLGRIVRKRFLKEADPIQSAIDWLQKQAPDGL